MESAGFVEGAGDVVTSFGEEPDAAEFVWVVGADFNSAPSPVPNFPPVICAQ